MENFLTFMSSPFVKSNEVKGKVLDVQFYISQCAVLAHNLLYLAEPKPGGACCGKPFDDTSAGDFFAGGSSLFAPIFELSKRGILVAQNHMWFEDAEIGFFVKKGIEESKRWYKSRNNTILGTLLMFAPLATSVAYFYANQGMRTNIPLDLDVVTEITEQFLKQSTNADCVNITKVLTDNVSTRILPSDKPEDNFDSFLETYKYENTNLFELTKFYEQRDRVFKELGNRYSVTINMGYEFFKKIYNETEDFMQAISQTYLNLLAAKTDTHIAKRFGNEIAKNVKKQAESIIKKGGIFTEEGRKLIASLDDYLRNSQSRNINCGSTADLTATVIFLALLDDYRV